MKESEQTNTNMSNASVVDDGGPNEFKDINVQHSDLSKKETKKIVTPYAFHVSENLFGTHLASPGKRAIAISVDMVLISLLTQTASFLLAGIAAATFFRAGNRLKQKKRFNKVRIGLRLLAASLLFVFLFGIFDEFNGMEDELEKASWNTTIKNAGNSGYQGVKGLAVAGITVKYVVKAGVIEDKVLDKSCESIIPCWRALGDELTNELAGVDIQQNDKLVIIDAVLEVGKESLSEEEFALIESEFKQGYSDYLILENLGEQTVSEEPSSKLVTLPVTKTELTPVVDEPNKEFSPSDEVSSAENQTENNTPSVIDWMKGFLDDLGLGFGWAAFYFSIFTAWWKGQTPGKKLLGIKVLKLDEGELNLWESFGRYGGYGAGFATGLLGFLQVYWDPNRQAIQDKISETLVIDVRKEKIPFSLAD